MISNSSKVTLGVFALFLVAILFTSGSIGFLFLFIEGILALAGSILLAKDVQKLDNSPRSKTLSVILISTLLYSIAWLCYGLGNIGVGDMGLPAMFLSWFYVLLLVISIVIGFSFAGAAHNPYANIAVYRGNPNKILILILLPILAVLFYGSSVTALATALKNPSICSLHIKSDRYASNSTVLFSGEAFDSCVHLVINDTHNASYCRWLTETPGSGLGDVNFCVRQIALELKDTNSCYQMIGDNNTTANCVLGVIEDQDNPALCENPVLESVDPNNDVSVDPNHNISRKDFCYSTIVKVLVGHGKDVQENMCTPVKDNYTRYSCIGAVAAQKKDASICRKYIPPTSAKDLLSTSANDIILEGCIKGTEINPYR